MQLEFERDRPREGLEYDDADEDIDPRLKVGRLYKASGMLAGLVPLLFADAAFWLVKVAAPLPANPSRFLR